MSKPKDNKHMPNQEARVQACSKERCRRCIEWFIDGVTRDQLVVMTSLAGMGAEASAAVHSAFAESTAALTTTPSFGGTHIPLFAKSTEVLNIVLTIAKNANLNLGVVYDILLEITPLPKTLEELERACDEEVQRIARLPQKPPSKKRKASGDAADGSVDANGSAAKKTAVNVRELPAAKKTPAAAKPPAGKKASAKASVAKKAVAVVEESDESGSDAGSGESEDEEEEDGEEEDDEDGPASPPISKAAPKRKAAADPPATKKSRAEAAGQSAVEATFY